MAVLNVQDRTGSVATSYVAASGGGDTVPGTVVGRSGGWGGVHLVVRNGGAGAITVTDPAGVATSVAAAGVESFPVPWMGAGGATFTYSGVTSVTVAAVRTA